MCIWRTSALPLNQPHRCTCHRPSYALHGSARWHLTARLLTYLVRPVMPAALDILCTQIFQYPICTLQSPSISMASQLLPKELELEPMATLFPGALPELNTIVRVVADGDIYSLVKLCRQFDEPQSSTAGTLTASTCFKARLALQLKSKIATDSASRYVYRTAIVQILHEPAHSIIFPDVPATTAQPA